ncbi:MAG: dihydropteridine reductase [Clostridia bacterium]|nr:dihydropteridine reductase [Clostridia bacterium]
MTKQTQTTIEQIRADYIPQEPSQFEQLKKLDKKVKAPAEIFAYTFGSVASLILGTGMCLAMKVIGASLSFGMPLGIGIGVLGMALMTINYPIYKKILQSRKNKYADQIIALSDSLLNE